MSTLVHPGDSAAKITSGETEACHSEAKRLTGPLYRQVTAGNVTEIQIFIVFMEFIC